MRIIFRKSFRKFIDQSFRNEMIFNFSFTKTNEQILYNLFVFSIAPISKYRIFVNIYFNVFVVVLVSFFDVFDA